MCFNNNGMLDKDLVPVKWFPLALVAVRSKVVVLLLLIYCLFLLPLNVVILCLVIVLLFSTLCPSFAIILMGKR